MNLKGRNFLKLMDFTPEELDRCVRGAYAPGKFSSPKVAPLVHLTEDIHVLELWLSLIHI